MEKCDVLIWDKKIGELSYNNFRLMFRYTNIPPFEISPLMLSTENTVYDYTDLPQQKHLAGVFADSLPDNYGQRALNKYFNTRRQEANEIDKLLFIGNKTMGAITYSPAANNTKAYEQTMSIQQLHDNVKEVITESTFVDTELGVHILKSVSPIGGAKPKALIGFKEVGSPIYIGPRNADIPEGYTPSIIKLATGEEGATANHLRTEYAYMQIASFCGINTPQIDLTDEGHYVIRRFDRRGSEKLHMHTLQGLIHSDFLVPRTVDYEDAFRVMLRLQCPKSDFSELYRRMVFNYLFRNHDDHEKNISFLMDRKGNWRLSPAYDLTYNYKPGGMYIGDHQLTFNGRVGNEVTLADFTVLAETFDIKEYQEIIRTVKIAREQLGERLEKVSVEDGFAKEIVTSAKERTING